MKYTTRAFKAKLLEIINRFQEDYPRPSIQQEAAPYTKILQWHIVNCQTSSSLYVQVQAELKKMPYWFSKVGYLVQALRELLKINNQAECIDTDEREKAELVSANQHPSSQSSHTDLLKQLQNEQTKNQVYLERIDRNETEKCELLNKLNTEISKGLTYKRQIKELLGQQAISVQEPDNIIIQKLQQFVQTLMDDNQRLSTELVTINNKYLEALENNKLLQKKYVDLEKHYQKLEQQQRKQNEETQQLRSDFEARFMRLEQSQVGSCSPTQQSFFSHHARQSSPINIKARGNIQSNSTHEKLSL